MNIERRTMVAIAACCASAVALPRWGAAQPVQPGTTLVLDGRLAAISTGPGFVCGRVGWAVVARYEVLRVHRGRPLSRVQFVVVPCGNLPGDGGVHVGEVHRLELGPLPRRFGLSVYDDFRADRATRLLLLRSTAAASTGP